MGCLPHSTKHSKIKTNQRVIIGTIPLREGFVVSDSPRGQRVIIGTIPLREGFVVSDSPRATALEGCLRQQNPLARGLFLKYEPKYESITLRCEPISSPVFSTLEIMTVIFTAHGCACFPEILENFSKRQVLWSLFSEVSHALTLKLHIHAFCGT